jgi:hypothetical protein
MRRSLWWILLLTVIGAGILSRLTRTGSIWIDKYLGDALYAVMVYIILRLTGRIQRVTVWTAIVMAAIELFQLTRIPAALLGHPNKLVSVCGRLLGTEFSFLDLLAYAVGIAAIAFADKRVLKT